MMSKDRAWGGELEMSILSKLYKCGFLIHANNRPNISVNVIITIFYRLTAVKIYKTRKLIIWLIISMNIIAVLLAYKRCWTWMTKSLRVGILINLKESKNNLGCFIGYLCFHSCLFHSFISNSSNDLWGCLLYTSPSPRDRQKSRMPSSA